MAPMTSARGKRTQPPRRSAALSRKTGRVSAGGSNGGCCRSGASGPAGPRRRRGRRRRMARRQRTGRKPSTRQSRIVAPDTASAAQITRWGVQARCTVKSGPPSVLRSAAVMCHPLAKPSTSWGVPRSTERGPRRGVRARLGHRVPALVDALPEDELEAGVLPAHRAGMAVDVLGRLGHRRRRPGLGGRKNRGAGRRRRGGRSRRAAGGRIEHELVDVPPRAGRRVGRAVGPVAERCLHNVRSGRRVQCRWRPRRRVRAAFRRR